jgi:pyrophosphatase PpaX
MKSSPDNSARSALWHTCIPSAILFDLDGTLLDSIELIVRSFQHATAAHLDAPYAREVIIPTIGTSLIDELERIAPGRGAELITTYRAYLHRHHDALVTLYPGVREMLAGIQEAGLPMGIVTSKSRISAGPSFARFALDRPMRVVITYEDTERHKPHPDPLLHAARALDLSPDTCWYIGDSTHDMEAARAAGMVGIGVTWGPYSRQSLEPLADALVETPEEILTLLQQARSKTDLPESQRYGGVLS